MNTKAGFSVIFMIFVLIFACSPEQEQEISKWFSLMFGKKDVGIKVEGKLTSSPDAVYYPVEAGASCGDDVLNFEFTWPSGADYDNRFIPPADVYLYYSLSIPGDSSSHLDSLRMQGGSSSDIYTASLDVAELASALSFDGTMPELEYWVKATGNYHAHDIVPETFDSKSTTILRSTIFETAHRVRFIVPCYPATAVPPTLEPGQFTLTPSDTPVPSETPTPTATPTKQPTKKPRCVPDPQHNITCP